MSFSRDAFERFMGPFRIRRLAVVAFALMLLGAAAQAAMTPRIHVADTRNFDLETLIPNSFGGWREVRARNLVLPDPSSVRLVNKIYNVTLTRAYRRADGAVVMLVIAYGGDQSDALQLHRPEICFAANGYHVEDPYYDDVRFAGTEIHLARVATHNDAKSEPVSYWMRVGERQVTSNFDRQIAKLASGLRGVVPDGVLVRVSTRTWSSDPAHDFSVQDQFIGDLLKSLDPGTRELLVGRSAAAGEHFERS